MLFDMKTLGDYDEPMKKHDLLPVIGAIVIPLLLILFVIVAAYAPTTSIKPTYDFLYSDKYSYISSYELSVVDSKLEVKKVTENASDLQAKPNLFRYDIQTGATKRLHIEEAQQLKLSNDPVSPDGYHLVTDRTSDIGILPLLFIGGDDQGVYIKKDKAQKKIDVDPAAYYNFELIGWILEN